MTSIMPSEASIKDLTRLIKLHGAQAHSYFHLQEGIRYFLKPDLGFISFGEYKPIFGEPRRIIFGNPVCAKEDLKDLIENFLETYPRNSIFVGVEKSVCDILEPLGYATNDIGIESVIDLRNFDLGGGKMRYFRRVRSRLGCIEVREQRWSEVDQQAVLDLSSAWLKTKRLNRRELKLVTRPPVFSDEWQVRKFFCYKDGELLGYIFFDPFFVDDRCIGYCATILRNHPKIKNLPVLDYCMLQAIFKFQKENIPFLALGLSPFHKVRKVPNEWRFLRWGLHTCYQFEIFYNYKKLAFHKARYRGQANNLYCAMPKGNPLVHLYSLVKGVQMF